MFAQQLSVTTGLPLLPLAQSERSSLLRLQASALDGPRFTCVNTKGTLLSNT